MLGRTVSVGRERGEGRALDDGTELWLTSHPSYLLRLQDEARHREREKFMADLQAVAGRLAQVSPAAARR